MTKKARKRCSNPDDNQSDAAVENRDSQLVEEDVPLPTGLIEVINNINTFQRFFTMVNEVSIDSVDEVLAQTGDLAFFLGMRIQFFKQECEARTISCTELGKFQFKCIELLAKFPDDRDALLQFNDFMPKELLMEFYFETIDRLESYVKSQFDALPIETVAHAVGCFFREMGNVRCVSITTLRGPFRDIGFLVHLFEHDLIECVFWSAEQGDFVRQDQVLEEAPSFAEFAEQEIDADEHSPLQVHFRLSEKGRRFFDKVTKPLDGKYKECAEYIEHHPGRLYDVIAKAVHISVDYCRQEILPVLEMRGFWKLPRKGWYPPRFLKNEKPT